jgi:hypothetical protein
MPSLLLFNLLGLREFFYTDLIEQKPVLFSGFIRNDTTCSLLAMRFTLWVKKTDLMIL